MKIIGIAGSPRKGNTEWMLSRLMELAAQKGAKTEILLLRKMDIRMCRGCLACEAGGKNREGICVMKDDMNSIYPRLLNADAIVLASPGYFEMISGLLKNFLDRTCPIWPKMRGRKIAGLAAAEEGIGQTVQNFKTYASLCQMKWIGSVTVLAKTPGDAAKLPEAETKLKRLATKLLSQDLT